MRSIGPRQAALLAAMLVAVVGGVLSWLVMRWAGVVLITEYYLLIGGALFVCAFIIILLVIERFTNSRIKLIYRTMLQPVGGTKGTGSDALERTEAEVAAWTSARSMEITELQEREKFRREFIGNIAHELKTPIFSVQGYVLTLLEGGLEDEKVNRAFLERASNGVDRLIKIVEDLDMISKMESGVLEMRTERADLGRLVSTAVEELELRAQEKQVTLVNTIEDALPVLADEDRIVQVLTNLLNNAINYSKPGGRCEVRAHDLDDRVLVEVSDDGIGIAPEHLPRLFERFYRVGKSRARNEGGSGLGLAIVKHIIESHGQTITVTSSEGQGTTFAFTLARPR